MKICRKLWMFPSCTMTMCVGVLCVQLKKNRMGKGDVRGTTSGMQ